MKNLILILILAFTCGSMEAQTLKEKLKAKADSAKKKATGIIKKDSTAKAPSLSNEEVIAGLREALTVGTNSATALASKADGYYKNPRLFIPWPEEAADMKAKLIKMGYQKKITEFETSLNRAAEEAAKNATPIFVDAIKAMTISDGFAILNGSSDTAATNYLRKATYDPLYQKFLPVVKEAINKVKVTSYWNPLVTTYNKLPGVKKQNPNLDDYVTKKAENGLFILVADEEAKIRKDPAKRVSDLLKKVFGFKK